MARKVLRVIADCFSCGLYVTQRRGLSRPAHEILTYFLRNPDAVDSLEGIARWRLREEAIHRKVIETQSALEWLLEEHFLIEVTGPHSTRLFRLNPEKQNQAESLVEPAKRKKPVRRPKS
ncbi:MAG: hypothetical protein ABSB35_23335 [Bryobacteraceae bacterium]